MKTNVIVPEVSIRMLALNFCRTLGSDQLYTNGQVDTDQAIAVGIAHGMPLQYQTYFLQALEEYKDECLHEEITTAIEPFTQWFMMVCPATLSEYLHELGWERTENMCQWDHKPILADMIPDSGPGEEKLAYYQFEFVEIPGDNEFVYYYDLWSNIHYGYVGRALGFTESELEEGATFGDTLLVGFTDEADKLSVKIGLELFERHGYEITKEDITNMIMEFKPQFVQLYVQKQIEWDEYFQEFGFLPPSDDLFFQILEKDAPYFN